MLRSSRTKELILRIGRTTDNAEVSILSQTLEDNDSTASLHGKDPVVVRLWTLECQNGFFARL